MWSLRLCRCSSCESLCATIVTLLLISADGGMENRHVGVITGVVIGNGTEGVGINGTIALSRHPLRCPGTSGTIQGIGIPGMRSSRMSFERSITVTSRITP